MKTLRWWIVICILMTPAIVAAQDSATDSSPVTPVITSSTIRPANAVQPATSGRVPAPQLGGPAELWRGEVFGGFGYANLSSSALASRKHAGGWGASVTANVNRYFGLTADFSGFYDPECSEQDFNCFLDQLRTQQIVDYNTHTFMGGARFYIPRDNKRVFFHALVGGARTHSSVFDLNTNTGTSATSGPNLAMAFGGGFDWFVAERVAIRFIQADIVPVREAGNWRNSLRFQFGAVYRFAPKE